MKFGQVFRITLFLSSIPIGIWLFDFAMSRGFNIYESGFLGFSPMLEVMTKIFFQIRHGEIEFKKLGFIKRIGQPKTQQDIIYEAKE